MDSSYRYLNDKFLSYENEYSKYRPKLINFFDKTLKVANLLDKICMI